MEIEDIDVVSFHKRVEPFKYVSFDIFDTLIFRTFGKYRDVFEAVANRYQEVYKECIPDFPKERVRAERKSRKLRKGKEVSMEMIYEQLPYNAILRKRLREIEEYCEISNVVPNRSMVDFVHWCKRKGKTIVLTTDMYLPRHVIEAMMVKVGVSFDYLFISGEEGVTKRSGLLFPVVLQKLGISPRQIIHIGDDPNNDIRQPSSLGIASIERMQDKVYIPEYVREDSHSLYSSHLYNFVLRAYQRQRKITIPFRLGFSVIGPLMYEFCTWLHKMKQENGISRLVFVSREGYFIKRCYDKMYGEQTDYVRLNRNILRLPSLRYGNAIDKFIEFLPDSTEYSWKSIFNMFLVKDHVKMCDCITAEIGSFSYQEAIPCHVLKGGGYNDILSILISRQKQEIIRQAELLDAYIKEKNLLNTRVGLVNNSLNGTAQTLLEQYLNAQGKRGDFVGLQFVKRDKCVKRLGDRCRGWITENGISHYRSFLFEEACILLEHFLFEPIGTSLYLDDGTLKIQVVCEKPRMEARDFPFIKEVQSQAMRFIEEYRGNLEMSLEMESFSSLMRLLQKPTKEDAVRLSGIYDDDEDGGRPLNDISLSLSLKQVMLGKFTKDVMWREGHFKVREKLMAYRVFYNLRLMLRCYHTTPKYMAEDVKGLLRKFFFNNCSQPTCL